jgi:glycosyltransferase involved in cell wall biosynthesis
MAERDVSERSYEMRLGIDASNLRDGGGITHLAEILRAARPQVHGFSQIIVWGGQQTLAKIEERPWLVKAPQELLNRSLPYRVFWQRFRLANLAKAAGCEILFAPGGSIGCDFHPVITMSRNLLPFEWHELRRYGCSWLALRGLILRVTQSRAFLQADGVIFLTRYGRDVVTRAVNGVANEKTTIIPHGIGNRFNRAPRDQAGIERYSAERPFRVLYVSIIDVYKHQWHVVDAIGKLRATGIPVTLELVGRAYPPALMRLSKALARVDPAGRFVRYVGPIAYGELHTRYAAADLCVFASSCENMPNILLEAMASGLPIACSNRGPMPELLGDAGVYFDPEQPDDIARAVGELIGSPRLRATLAEASFKRVQAYSWERCADETLRFLAAAAAVPGRGTSFPRVALSKSRGG